MGRFPIQGGDGGGGGGGQPFDPFTDIDPFSEFYFYDEMFYPSPSTHFPHFEQEPGQTINAVTNVTGGQVIYQSAATAGTVGRINLCASGLIGLDLSQKWRMVWRGNTDSIDANSAYYWGGGSVNSFPGGTFPFSTLNTDNPSIGFRRNGAGNWLTHTYDGTTLVEIDTGIGVDTAIHTFDIRFDPSGTPTLTFFIDNVLEHTQTTSIPTGLLRVIATVQTNLAAIRRMGCDSLYIYQAR